MIERSREPLLEIFDIARAYLTGDIPIVDVENWLVPNLGYFLLQPQTTAADLALTMELAFAELSDGLIDEDELRAVLNEFFLTHPDTFAVVGAPRLQTGADNLVLATTPVTFGARQPDLRYERIEL